ncbi:MAG TPA: hypothetical protein VKU00_02930, partial [Chthonomonadaceae bacterium]|nr:hypothetical protein [Chthonomonadaceae bacterium]
EARQELLRAIACDAPFGHSSQPWKAFDILHDLEREVGNTQASQQARQQAMQAYLSYRQDGGENMDQSRPLFEAVQEALATGQTEALAAQLTPLLHAPNTPDRWKALFRVLLRLLAGERASDLADDPELTYLDAVEVMLL